MILCNFKYLRNFFSVTVGECFPSTLIVARFAPPHVGNDLRTSSDGQSKYMHAPSGDVTREISSAQNMMIETKPPKSRCIVP
jgi:hypothetical protein